MRKKKFNKNKLYGVIANGGVGLSMIGLSTFLVDYVSNNHMNPALTIASVGIISIGGISTVYGSFKQRYNYDEVEKDEEICDPFENVFDLDYLELQQKELRLVEKAFKRDKSNMDYKLVNILSYNITKEKLLIKKILEEMDSELPSVKADANIIISMIIETGYDQDYLDYREKVLSTNVVDFPQYERSSNNISTKSKVLEFPKKQ